MPERNTLIKSFQDKPVKFIGVMVHGTVASAVLGYQSQTGLALPVFADNLNLMQKRYGFQISLNNPWQNRDHRAGRQGNRLRNDQGRCGKGDCVVEAAVEVSRSHR